MKPRRQPLLAAATTALLTMLAATPAGAAPLDTRDVQVIVQSGEYHLDVDFANGALTLDLKQWTGSDDLPASGTLLNLSPSSARTVPSGSQYACVGPAGATVYVAPQSQDPNLLWLGWNAVDVPAAQGPVRLELVGFDGPQGSWFSIYTTGALGQLSFKINTYGGFGCPVSIWPGGLTTGTYGVGNWLFSHQGNYTLKFRATAQNGAGATSGIVAYTFHVG
ncbi:choice-of-anchor M domain-containing protein [Actinomycetes bacterium KLBMP 9797]